MNIPPSLRHFTLVHFGNKSLNLSQCSITARPPAEQPARSTFRIKFMIEIRSQQTMSLAAPQFFHHTKLLHLSPAAPTHRFLPLKLSRLSSLKSNQSAQHYDDDGIPIEHVKTLAKFKSRHNYIRVIQVSRAADHPLAGSRLLLLDAPGNIHSISYLFKSLTNAYFDVFATLPPVLPPGPIGILGFGAGSAAKIILELYPEAVIHGWELDPSVIAVAREYFALEKMEKKYSNRLTIYTGNALNAVANEKFAGVLIDLFSKGCVIQELQDSATWEKLRMNLKRGGRMMVNVGGSCVEPDDIRKDGGVIMEETLKAMQKVFDDDVFVLSIDDRKDESSVALTGGLPDAGAWRRVLPRPLKFYVDMWKPYRNG